MPSMRKKVATITASGLTVGFVIVGLGAPAHAAETIIGGSVGDSVVIVETAGVDMQSVRASIREKGRVLRSAAGLLVKAEVPGEVGDIDKRTRLGLPTWRVVVEMESGYKVAAYVHRRTGVIIDWVVLKVPADVEYVPPKKDAQRSDLDPAKPKPAPVPAIIKDAVRAEDLGATAPASTPAATTPSSGGSSSGDSSHDGADGSDDRDGHDDGGDDSRRDASRDSASDERDSQDSDSRDDDSRDEQSSSDRTGSSSDSSADDGDSKDDDSDDD